MVLYFTTCNNKLYTASCKQLIESFIKYSNNNDNLIVFHENVNKLIKDAKVTYVNVDSCSVYTSWFNKYKDLIPVKYGGNALPECDIRLQLGLAVKWNQKACLWYWKIVAFKLILQYITNKIDYWVFLDSDTRFVSSIDTEFYKTNFHCALHYHLGKFRKGITVQRCAGIESGIIVFRNTPHTFNILNDLFSTFENGDFVQYVRWDDGYVLRMIVEKDTHSLHCVDLVPKANVKNVIEVGPFAGKICHDVGKHHRLKLDQ